jgi:hypothetical protein
MMKVNASIHTIHTGHCYEHVFLSMPILISRRIAPARVRAIQNHFAPYKVLGRALLVTRTDANSFDAVIRNPEVAFRLRRLRPPYAYATVAAAANAAVARYS